MAIIEQKVLSAIEDYKELDAYLLQIGVKRAFLVCGKSIDHLPIGKYLNTMLSRIKIEIVRFSDFTPNPSYESVVSGVHKFCESNCDAIIAVGGGSAIDVAKCIKLFSSMDANINYLQQEIIPNRIPLIAVPTTAGTGSEATRFAVIYYKGSKQSVTDDSCIPSAVMFDSSTLVTLPEYQRKVTMVDAMCHAIESFWSINSTERSKSYSRHALQLIFANMEFYLENEPDGNIKMLQAANVAGKAINITQTTAGHAMCYKLTTLYGIAHGHAAALCVAKLWPYMLEHTDRCIDPRGAIYLENVYNEIADAMGCKTAKEASEKFQNVLKTLCLKVPTAVDEDFQLLRTSVNLERLKNHPIRLDEETIDALYHQILTK